MLHEYSLAYLTAPGLAPPEMIELAARVGYDAVGLRLIPVTEHEVSFPLAEDQALLRRTKRQLTAMGIAVLDVELFRLTASADIGAFAPVLDACAELGARHIIAQAPDADVSRATEHLGLLCDAAMQRDLKVNLEFVTWTETSDLHTAARIVGGTGRDNAGILVDTLHFARSGCSTVELARIPRAWLRYAQICDAPLERPLTTEGLMFAARNERQFLGEGGLDLLPILTALPKDIPYSIEIPQTHLAQQIGVEELARRALESSRGFIEVMCKAGPLPRRVNQLAPRR